MPKWPALSGYLRRAVCARHAFYSFYVHTIVMHCERVGKKKKALTAQHECVPKSTEHILPYYSYKGDGVKEWGGVSILTNDTSVCIITDL